MSRAIIVPSGPSTSKLSIIHALKKSISKPFIGKKVAFLKASAKALGEEVKQKQDELDKVLDQLEAMDKHRDALATETDMLASKNASIIIEWENKLLAERSSREEENEVAKLKYESTKKNLDENVKKLRADKKEEYQYVWKQLNEKLREFQNEATKETGTVAIEKNAVISEKNGRIERYEKDKRSVRKMILLGWKSLGRKLS
mmetsp:Transcript_8260/g.10185  ORF Transcript_8260/g.10185 Transcript_8260/m.10185 type:complete len:202 (+) Transcript_8260:82-687(+)